MLFTFNGGTNRVRYITNGSRGTANAWHFYYALVFVVTVLCGKLVVALSAP
ncbi:DUF3265 domain-containing protein [Vibrio metschnikovii]|nr:DUF3265 domain-containing protein [Vibrio metschnikovii]EKO3594247.1 DUF3265 domain-containing protein [Vibrio metschnikovii]EKO3608562.1 DUF3265 domain-containing protein [Vibrio metschnikovii]EKO3612195.1 DUF3265 domain-containing protein [Vibrio metschnikovii]EKO3667572.1 DUF3265 domain-containing protein [Vibrio metschnikovii]